MENKELTLEEIQQESFKVLVVFRNLCNGLGLKYWLSYGTLIGAIRHNGFIPWDDDIDVQMPREDYEKFVDYCVKNKEQIKPYELHHYKTNKKYIYPIARLSDSRYVLNYTNARDYGLGLFIDIYPMDEACCDSKKLLKARTKYFRKILYAASLTINTEKTFKGLLKRIYFLKSRFTNKNAVLRKYDEMFKNKSFGTGNYSCYIWEYGIHRYKKEHFEKLEEHLFNGELFNIPSDYDFVLSEMYGNYMELPPKSERIAHHFYSAYKK